MKVLVTGANGYIGRHVIKVLLDRHVEVIACDITTTEVDKRAERMSLNLFDLSVEDVYSFLGTPDVCLHMAWRNGFVHNAPTQMGDLSAHYRFLTGLIDGGLPQLAVMGTMHEVGYWNGAIDEHTPCNPISLYGIAKDALRRSMIQYTQSKGCILQWLRCYYVVGDDKKNHSIFCKLLEAAEEGKRTFPFTSGKNKYDFITVDDLAQMIAAVIMQRNITGIINCCTGKPVSLGERVEQFIKECNLRIELEYGAFPERPYDSPCEYGDTSKISQIINDLKR